MATVQLTQKTFSEQIKKQGIVLIDWWAPWCGPCRMFGPIYERVAAKHPDVVFAKINTEEEPALATVLNIQSIPTLMVFRDGILLFSQPGMLPEKALEDLLKQVRALDMEEIRKQVASETPAA